MINFSKGDGDVSVTEFMADLFAIAAPQKQGLSDIHHDIKTKISARRCDREEFFAGIGFVTVRTAELRDMGLKLTDQQ